MRSETKQVLELFTEKADKLCSLRFSKSMLKRKDDSIHILFDGNGANVVDISPDSESVDSFVLTFRFFIQNNESISLRSLEKLCADPGLSNHWKSEYTQIRGGINTYLDSPVRFNLANETLSHKDVLYIFFYGELAHSNKEKRHVIEDWKKDLTLFQLRRSDFLLTLTRVLRGIRQIAEVSAKEIRTYEDNLSL